MNEQVWLEIKIKYASSLPDGGATIDIDKVCYRLTKADLQH